MDLSRKSRSDAGTNILTSSKLQDNWFSAYNCFKKLYRQQKISDTLLGDNSNIDDDRLFDLWNGIMSDEDRKPYIEMSDRFKERAPFLPGEITAILKSTDGSVTWKQIETALSEDGVPIVSEGTIRTIFMELDDSTYVLTRLFPALTKAHIIKRLLWCQQFWIFWDAAKALLPTKRILLVHMDEKWFYGIVIRKNKKYIPFLGMEQPGQVSVHHKNYVNKFMCLVSSVYLCNKNNIEAGGRGFHGTLIRAGHKEVAMTTTYNRKILKSITNSSNPVARIVSTTISSLKAKIANSHFDEDRIPLVVLLAKTARVQITGVNFNPAWGLYHGSIGEVIDIVFDDGGNPNYNSLPLYVLVDFPQYKGPKFLKTHKTWVPIPVHTCRCDHNCCERMYVPLTLAYGKTAHTVQGLTAGPVEKGRAENLIKSIVVDPGTKKFEGKCVGLFYTLLGRGTTLGNRSDLMSSAVYFNGVNMSHHRITNLWQSAKGTPFKLVHLRQSSLGEHRGVTENFRESWNMSVMSSRTHLPEGLHMDNTSSPSNPCGARGAFSSCSASRMRHRRVEGCSACSTKPVIEIIGFRAARVPMEQLQMIQTRSLARETIIWDSEKLTMAALCTIRMVVGLTKKKST